MNRIRKEHKGSLGEWPLPSGNRVRIELKIKGHKSRLVPVFLKPHESLTQRAKDEEIVRRNIMPLVEPRRAYICTGLRARSKGKI